MAAPSLLRSRLRSGALGTLVALCLAACNKDEPIPSKVALLTSHSWHLDGITSSPAYSIKINGQTKFFTDIFEMYRAQGDLCALDERLRFTLDTASNEYEVGNFQNQVGQLGCQSRPRTVNWNWLLSSFGSNRLYIVLKDGLDSPDIISQFRVYELNSEQLVMECTYPSPYSNPRYTWHYTLSAE